MHVVHDYRRQRGPYRLSNATATAILLTSLTTMVGFGSMMIAGHQGLRSLDRVLTLGVGCCLFMSIVVLPCLLNWLSRARNLAVAEVEDEPEPAAAAQLAADAPGSPVLVSEAAVVTPDVEAEREEEPARMEPQRRLIRPRRVA